MKTRPIPITVEEYARAYEASFANEIDQDIAVDDLFLGSKAYPTRTGIALLVIDGGKK